MKLNGAIKSGDEVVVKVRALANERGVLKGEGDFELFEV